jgi:hypothetical protein
MICGLLQEIKIKIFESITGASSNESGTGKLGTVVIPGIYPGVKVSILDSVMVFYCVVSQKQANFKRQKDCHKHQVEYLMNAPQSDWAYGRAAHYHYQ